MFERLKPKVSTSITIDQELYNKLQELKKAQGVESLSPVINEILWDWLKKQVEVAVGVGIDLTTEKSRIRKEVVKWKKERKKK